MQGLPRLRGPAHRLAAAALVLPLAAAAPAGLVAPAPSGEGFPEHPASAGDTVVDWDELDRVLLNRYGYSEAGKFALEHLLKTEFLAHLADEREVEVTDAQVSARWSALDRAARESGLEGGLLQEIRDRGIAPETFRDLLRLAIVHERLTRDALDLPEDADVTAAQQNVWIEQAMTERGLETPPPPWPDGVAARCGPVSVSSADLARALRTDLPADEVCEACMQILLVERLRERMPDLSAEAERAAIAGEIERRRSRAAENPRYQGVELESLLRAQGMVPERFDEDPAVVAAALARLWVDRNHGPEGLRRVYEAERKHFEEKYGEAALIHLLFLSAARNPNELQPRSTAEAREILERLADDTDDLEAFAEKARALSDDRPTRERGGRLGWVTRGAPGVPEELRVAAFEDLRSGSPLPPGGRPVGPVELETGVALLWLEERRDSPEWERMADEVHRELRGRLASEVLPPDSVSCFRD